MNMVIAATTTTTREVQRRIALYDSLAAENGWTKVKITTDNSRVQRQRYKQMRHGGGDGDEMVVVDCWPTTGVIGSYLKHPKQGKTQLFRKECSDEEVAKVFVDPRSHTGKGYQRRPENDDRKKREREGKVTDDETSNDDRSADEQQNRYKRRRLACQMGQTCRDWDCPFSHPPRCFFGPRCWFEPNCWFDHTHGLCRFGVNCTREDCWFSHRNPDFFY